jgi:hypothetical protein
VTIRTTENNSGLSEERSFSLLVKCVQSISPDSVLAIVLYFITDPVITRTPTYALTPADCPNELVLTVTLSNNSLLPASITYLAPAISIHEMDYARTGTYQVMVVATDPKTGINNSALSF